MLERLTRLKDSRLLHSAFYNYMLHFSRYLVPLMVMPYLSRVLGPTAYGHVFVAISFGMMLSLIVEFGFSLSATRELAKHRDDQRAVGHILADVLGAKLTLTAAALLIGVTAVLLLPRLRETLPFSVAGIAYGLVFGMSPMWYYQAIEKMRVQSALEICGQFGAMIFIFILVHGPSDAIFVPVLQGLGVLTAVTSGYVILYRDVGFVPPTIAGARTAIRLGWTLFLFQASVMLFTTANVFLVGVLLPSDQAAIYGTAEKLFLVFTGIFLPMTQTIFPRMNYLLLHEPGKALRLAKISIGLVSAVSLVMIVGIWLTAPFLIHLLFGSAFSASVPITRLLSFGAPAIAANYVLGIQCMLPLHMDKAYSRITYAAGILTISLAPLLVPHFGITAMAFIKVGTESFIALSIAAHLWRCRQEIALRLNPLESF